jgi:SAM-dependent methyltransferase
LTLPLLEKSYVLTPIKYVVTAAVCIYLLRQVRKPAKWVGRPFLWMMNLSHSNLTDWGLSHVQVEKQFAILDVGCGGGRTIRKLAALATEGKVFGIDYAKGSVAASRAKNAELISAGRVEIKQASVSQLPFPSATFDLVTAVETQYYWPDVVNDMREIFRVLKPGGMLMIVAETYRKGAHNWLLGSVMKLISSSSLSVDDQHYLFSSAGFLNVQIFEERRRGWISAIGKSPNQAQSSSLNPQISDHYELDRSTDAL